MGCHDIPSDSVNCHELVCSDGPYDVVLISINHTDSGHMFTITVTHTIYGFINIDDSVAAYTTVTLQGTNMYSIFLWSQQLCISSFHNKWMIILQIICEQLETVYCLYLRVRWRMAFTIITSRLMNSVHYIKIFTMKHWRFFLQKSVNKLDIIGRKL